MCRILYFSQVVLADGRLATCTHNQTIIEENGTIKTRNDGELFWALRGGGGGTFGIVEHYVLKLHPVQESYVEVNIRIPLHRNASDATIIKRGIEAYDQWVRTVPPYWGGAIAFFKDVLFARIFKHGPWNANTESELRPFYDLESYYDQLLQITNVSIAAPYLVADPYKNARLFQIGGLVPPDKHISTGLRDLLTYEVMDDRNGRLFCYFYRLGGTYQQLLAYDFKRSM